MRSIAIEREFGSGGREVGRLAAQLLGVPFYDGELLLDAAEHGGADLSRLRNFDERQAGSLLYDLALAGSPNQYSERTSLHEMFATLQNTIRRLAGEGPAVFIGRCSTDALSGRDSGPRALRTFIYASDAEARCARVMETEGVGESEARRMIRHKDKEREQYFRYFTQKNWGDRTNYDIQLNTSVLPAQQCAELLAEMARRLP